MYNNILLHLHLIAAFIWYFFENNECIKSSFKFFTLKLFRMHLWSLKRDF